MKILFISMHSIHTVRWIENLKESEYDLYWYDILGKGKLETLPTVKQFIETKKRKLPHIKGEYSFSKKMPGLYGYIRPFLETTENEVLERIIKEINPDVIHSFEMQSVSYSILKTMNKFPEIKWIYSCWGNDLFYYQNFQNHRNKIKNVLKRVDYLHTDCLRDYEIAKENGYKGIHIGVIPGGTGYKIKQFKVYKKPIKDRNIILVKGYQNIFGRGLNIIKALQKLKTKIEDYEIFVFGTHVVVEKYIIENDLDYKVYSRHDLTHQQIMELMGSSILYIGNNISDGMANTLLEAVVMGAFPIQSNPGNVSAEIIKHGTNGLLIEDPENIDSIAQLIIQVIENKEMLINAYELNNKIALEKLDYNINQQKVIALYKNLENKLSESRL
ncbi:Glycosyl transferase 4-like [Flavobacterium sp. CF108]|jgi:glycosyltransferase involved in cell wall biosynthesis|uniref:glycosyltransferase n=1 Tax=unclassified Flavobacterium TaxID=196869 RepID=UPI0008B14D53|nr:MULTISPECIES: glycosyltransferase [unclassified Flavobacterium]SEO49211.1 Glycosyl transferase 4-like [Flavobacterium sp. fv08]SHH72005.1 Glycosyl transferase 4-like [Flavobacterium sp. CF108]